MRKRIYIRAPDDEPRPLNRRKGGFRATKKPPCLRACSLLFTAESNVTLHVRMTLVPTYSGPVGLTLTTISGLGTKSGGRGKGQDIGREEREYEKGERGMN